ncbi:hypothetical protein EV363DRAFT_1327772 [Boletus edulis]|uniref:Uncharacterized protein n=1 Tax=Boletus edulis BED1 TaxID=1328754 RepID=A0AAD4BYT8_BOLED|nr:hypothetical protein EV363DRAFT_1327772 [Boletus edulis]KAF8443840.1 hypothetical protein L210DRAFT_3532652 [Boletus edulis BED1]
MPEVFPYDLARKPYHEMITKHLCIAMTDDDREIAALRPLGREGFTHIVRVVFDPPSRNNIMPSSWRAQTMYANDGALELRLTCPALTLGYDGKLTALNEKQLRNARDFIKHAMPERNDTWVEQGHKFPFSRDECDDTRLLVVAPLDRSADVMAILICYMPFLTGESADRVLGSIQWLKLVHSYWRGDHLGKGGLDKANEVSKQKW